ncbi:MAG TPA: glycoside hydrolase family 3 N-terminal domain-containing protein [Gemmatimonadaceae bacterium]|jgi:beta-N-acetylhexosaminidase
MSTMSSRDKAAQLVWPQLFGDYAPLSTPGWTRIQDLIQAQHVGGFIVSIGSPIETAVKLNAMQRLSALPLIIGADYETGAGFRQRQSYFLPNNIGLGGATMFPYQMGLGASRDTSLAYEQGRITAIEGRALGVHIAFAPVLDVNNNPGNPVIGMRSFGEDPHLVADMGQAMIHGIQEHGMIATGKHFPGHGDTDENSHLTITTVHASRAELDSVELVPFRRAIATGVQGMMTFHGLIPALDTASVPATLNPAIMTGLLRKQLGFNGLLVTDAMDMNGVLARVTVGQTAAATAASGGGGYGTALNNSIGIGEACKLAIVAGADILLMPSDIPASIDAVVAGVREGRFTQARVDSSVRRVLMMKQQLDLNRRRLVDLDTLRSVVGDTANVAIAALAAERGITLAKDSLKLVPLVGTATQRVLSITIAGRTELTAGTSFNGELRRVAPSLRSEQITLEDPAPNFDRILAVADSFDVAVVGSYVTTGTNVSNASAPEPIAHFLRELVRRHPRTIVVAFGNPYLLQQVPDASTYLVAWGGFPVSQTAAGRAVIGAASIRGRLPISIPPVLRFGAGVDRLVTPRAVSP